MRQSCPWQSYHTHHSYGPSHSVKDHVTDQSDGEAALCLLTAFAWQVSTHHDSLVLASVYLPRT